MGQHYRRRLSGPHLDQTGNANYPAFHLRHRALGRGQFGFEEGGEAAVPIGARQPGGDAEGAKPWMSGRFTSNITMSVPLAASSRASFPVAASVTSKSAERSTREVE